MRLESVSTRRTLPLIAALLALWLSVPGWTQVDDRQDSEPQVAPDLQSVYRKTSTARTVSDFSAIIEFCRKVDADANRPAEEQVYARNLLSWAANKRGEMRSDEAANCVAQKKTAEAKQLDELAMKDFELAIKCDPKRWRAHHNRAITLALQGKTTEALESFDRVIELNPSYANAFFNRGEVHFQNKRYEAAIADYSKAIALDSNDASLYSARGHAKFAKGQSDDALADYAVAMELAPESSTIATEYADASQSLGLWKQAAESYQQAMKLDSNNVRALQNAAWMMATCPDDYFRDGQAAVQTATKAISAEGTPSPSANLLDVLAAAYAANGEFDAAQDSIRRALKSTSEPSLRQEMLARGNLYQRQRTYTQPAVQATTQLAQRHAPHTAPVRQASNPTRRGY